MATTAKPSTPPPQQGERYERDPAQVSVTVNGKVYQGWLQSDIQRSIETLAGTFNVPVTLVPGNPPAIARQDKVTVQIGGTTVITGYVLGAEPFYRRDDCGMKICGRDRTGDLVTASAIHKGGQWRNAPIDRIIKDIVAPFGIEVVVAVKGDALEPIKEFKIEHAEAALATIARVAKLRGVLVLPDERGRLVITRAGTQVFDGAIVRGSNVISMESIGTDENRHSVYMVYGQSNVTTAKDFDKARGLKAQAKDAEIKRYLPLVINADGNRSQKEMQDLAQHTMRVRRGHARGYKYTVEGWTFKGKPWPLNQLVPVYDDVAGMNGEKLLICEIHHRCDLREGDVTELTLRPPEAYDTVRQSAKVKVAKKRRRKRKDEPESADTSAWLDDVMP